MDNQQHNTNVGDDRMANVRKGNQPAKNLQQLLLTTPGWLGSRVISTLNTDAEGPGFKSQLQRSRVTVLGKLFTPIVPLFTKQQNW